MYYWLAISQDIPSCVCYSARKEVVPWNSQFIQTGNIQSELRGQPFMPLNLRQETENSRVIYIINQQITLN